jgi:hypothetical protein
MRRKALMVLLALGTVVGFGSGIHRVAHRMGCHHPGWGAHGMGASAPCGGDWDRAAPAAPPGP